MNREAMIDMKTVSIDPNSELGTVLDHIDEEDIVLLRNGTRFRVVREEDPFANQDPEKVRAAIRAMHGTLKGVDTKALIEELRESRSQDSTGRPAW